MQEDYVMSHLGSLLFKPEEFRCNFSSFASTALKVIQFSFYNILVIISFSIYFHYSTSGRISGLNEEVKEVKSSLSKVLSEKKKLQKKLNDFEKVGCCPAFWKKTPLTVLVLYKMDEMKWKQLET